MAVAGPFVFKEKSSKIPKRGGKEGESARKGRGPGDMKEVEREEEGREAEG